MTDTIRVPYTELLQRAARIREQADAVRREITTLGQTVDGIEWIGSRAARFFGMWAEARPEMERWAAALDGFADELEAQARRMQAADDAF
ncbi:MAG: WXG100 family type VII secretion target [bacterium]|nr:WXG100 family type VII secretion target [bacterium]